MDLPEFYSELPRLCNLPPDEPEEVAPPKRPARRELPADSLERIREAFKLTHKAAEKLSQKIVEAPYGRHKRDRNDDDDLTCTVMANSRDEELRGQRVVQVNPTAAFIAEGGHKRIKQGFDVTVPSLEVRKIVRICLTPEHAVFLAPKMRLHNELRRRFHNPARGIRISAPVEARRVAYIEKENQVFVVEYAQEWYPTTLLDVEQANNVQAPWTFQTALRVFIDLAETLLALNAAGIAHCDVKPENTLLDEQLNPYLHDFDCTTQIWLDGGAPYAYWDVATQNGLFTPYADLVGFAVSMVMALLPVSKIRRKLLDDDTHDMLGKPDGLRTLMAEICANPLEGMDQWAAHEILRLASGVIQAEHLVHGRLVASLVRYMTKLADQDDATKQLKLRERIDNGVRRFVLNRLADGSIRTIHGRTIPEICAHAGRPITPDDIENLLRAVELSKEAAKEIPVKYHDLVALFRDDLSPETMLELIHLGNRCVDTLNGIADIQNLEEVLSAYADGPELWRLIMSRVPADRVRGYAMLTEGAPSLLSVQTRLKQMLAALQPPAN